MSTGYHVGRTAKSPLHLSIVNGMKDIPGMRCAQIFTHGPRDSKLTKFNETELLKLTKQGVHVWVHSTYVTSWKPDKWWHIYEQLDTCDHIGASGLILHIPKEMPSKIAASVRALRDKGYKTPLILEMRALKPDVDTYETPTKLIALVDALKEQKLRPEDTGICIDTAHIYAGRAEIKTREDAEKYLQSLDSVADYIQLLHLNGNQYDAKLRAGDKHTSPHGPLDKLWGDLDPDKGWKSYGCRVFAKWFLDHKRDVILEQPIGDKKSQKITTLIHEDRAL